MSNAATQERHIPPKRQRMLDMIMVLGGLKEDAAIPLSRVNEEIRLLKEELSPLTAEIVAYPEKYFQEFLTAVERTGIIDQITDPSILSEAINNLEAALKTGESGSLSTLLGLLQEAEAKHQDVSEETEPQLDAIDVAEVVAPLPAIIDEIETVIDEYDRQRAADAETAENELKEITETFANLVDRAMEDPENVLAELQKLGSKTRYGPFLRAAAQLKRGRREGRIPDDRFARLVAENMVTEMRRGIIMFILNHMGSRTVPQLAELMKTTPALVQRAIITMIQRSDVEIVGVEGDAPVFARVLGAVPESTLAIKRVVQQFRSLVKTVDETTAKTLNDALSRLSSVLERLQLLGEYDETRLADSVKQLRELADKSTEAALSTPASTDTEQLKLLISAGLEAFARFRLKITLEKGPNLVEGTNVYGEKLDPEVYRRIMDTYLDNEIERGTILLLIREHGAMTVKDLAERTGIPPDRVLQHLLRMKRDELLTIAGETHGYVLYDVPRTPNEAEVAVQTVTALARDLAPAMKELEALVEKLTPKDIGRLVNTIEIFSKSRDKMAKLNVGGAVVAEDILTNIEGKIKSALAMAYRTRARIPSTRPKVTIDDLMDVDVPTVMDEYRDMMGYAPLLGFGTINWDHSKCLGCKSCELACPEDAIFLKPVVEIPQFFEFSEESLEKLPANKALFYRTVRSLATRRPTENIMLQHEAPGFGHIEVDLWLCVACRTCVRRCPGPDEGALELELKWSLPEVVKHITAEAE
ncbi:MAG: 4Fe-4S dicluster domain-containing protein [Candidatus Thorarchaeota archaeon]